MHPGYMLLAGSHRARYSLQSLHRTFSNHPSVRSMESSKKKDRKHGGKLKGNKARDDHETRLSKTLCYVLRHGAEDEGIPIRPDGYVRVSDLVGIQISLPFLG